MLFCKDIASNSFVYEPNPTVSIRRYLKQYCQYPLVPDKPWQVPSAWGMKIISLPKPLIFWCSSVLYIVLVVCMVALIWSSLMCHQQSLFKIAGSTPLDPSTAAHVLFHGEEQVLDHLYYPPIPFIGQFASALLPQLHDNSWSS